MAHLSMSTNKYYYLLDNIDFFNFILIDQSRSDDKGRIRAEEFAEFLTKSPIDFTKGEVDKTLSLFQNAFKEELQKMKDQFEKITVIQNQDKVIYFLHHLMGNLNIEDEANRQMLPILLEYIEYHKALSKEKVKTKGIEVNHGRSNK